MFCFTHGAAFFFNATSVCTALGRKVVDAHEYTAKRNMGEREWTRQVERKILVGKRMILDATYEKHVH